MRLPIPPSRHAIQFIFETPLRVCTAQTPGNIGCPVCQFRHPGTLFNLSSKRHCVYALRRRRVTSVAPSANSAIPARYNCYFSSHSRLLFKVKGGIVGYRLFLEAPSRFELENEGFADLCLTTWLWCRYHIYVDFITLDTGATTHFSAPVCRIRHALRLRRFASLSRTLRVLIPIASRLRFAVALQRISFLFWSGRRDSRTRFLPHTFLPLSAA